MRMWEQQWQSREFARFLKVTVRTLHHYDRIGLLKPARRTVKGFRLYGERELARMQQINTLKFIGLPLNRIKELLDRQEFDLRDTLKLQRNILLEERSRLDQALRAIERAEKSVNDTGTADLDMFSEIIEVMNMEKNMDWTKKYYSEAAQAKIDERKNLWSPELQEHVTRDWGQLTKDVEAAIVDGVEPGDERAQNLAARWKGLVGEFTGGNPEIQEGLNKMYADRENWPEVEWKMPYGKEVEEFITEAMRSGK